MAKNKKQNIKVKHLEIGTLVKSHLRNSSGNKVVVTGVVKDVVVGWGYLTYTLTDCKTGDFTTRIVKKIKS